MDNICRATFWLNFATIIYGFVVYIKRNMVSGNSLKLISDD